MRPARPLSSREKTLTLRSLSRMGEEQASSATPKVPAQSYAGYAGAIFATMGPKKRYVARAEGPLSSSKLPLPIKQSEHATAICCQTGPPFQTTQPVFTVNCCYFAEYHFITSRPGIKLKWFLRLECKAGGHHEAQDGTATGQPTLGFEASCAVQRTEDSGEQHDDGTKPGPGKRAGDRPAGSRAGRSQARVVCRSRT
jgi:hypothetical protein